MLTRRKSNKVDPAPFLSSPKLVSFQVFSWKGTTPCALKETWWCEEGPEKTGKKRINSKVRQWHEKLPPSAPFL